MPQVFSRASNSKAKGLVIAGAAGVVLLGWGYSKAYRSPYETLVSMSIAQPVPFSHKHHAGELGIDCRYCHASVEKAAFAGMPPTETCMTCHSQLYTSAPMLAPVRQSLETQHPLQWTRVYDLPDFVYFNHSMHISHGIGCSSCHGKIDTMPLTTKATTLFMRECLECHENPEHQIRPSNQIFNPAWTPSSTTADESLRLSASYHIQKARLTDCSTCHR